MKKAIFYILKHIFHGKSFELYRDRRMKLIRNAEIKKAKNYKQRRGEIAESIKGKEQITILFFLYTMGMWKYHYLFRLLAADKRFNPIIVPFIMPHNNREYSLRNNIAILNYCKEYHFPYREGYDFDKNEYKDISDIKPDVVVYSQPYNLGYEKWLIDEYKDSALFLYTPYGAAVSKGKQFYDTYLINIAWKVFLGSPLEKKIHLEYSSLKQDNFFITGFYITDAIKNANPRKNPWKFPDKKHLIWAPHHSIDSQNSFSSSNFERMCDFMLEVAEKYRNVLEIAFKPHPVLKERLYEKWGKERTDEYYNKWALGKNTFMCLDDYVELFAYSDGMIHDCASFACEYLTTNHPVMYVCKDDVPQAGIDSEFGLQCFKYHYHGYETTEIEDFISRVVLKGDDPMKVDREVFYKEHLLPPYNCSSAENMYAQLLELVKN